jgi:mono/diheme cytochrome c family protein
MNSWKLLNLGLILSALATSAVLAQQAQPQASTGSTPDKPTRTAAATNPGGAPYTVKDGNKVDNQTLMGWRTWRALACERCHGAEQEGLVGPPLVESLKKLSKEDFHKTILNGRPEKGMPPFSASKMVTDNWEGLYAYLKGRSDGKIKPGHVYAIDAKK